MMRVRPVRLEDVDALYELAKTASAGLTTLPPSTELLEAKVKLSLESFAAEVTDPGEEFYLVVLEDGPGGRVVGTAGVFATVGKSRPFYSYNLVPSKMKSRDPLIQTRADLLVLSNQFDGACELATLYLDPAYRKGGNGALLSKSRYFLLAGYPERFPDIVMAELRGWVDENDRSPFWDAVGRKFFGLELAEADLINSLGNNQFIRDLMPTHPIYVGVLPEEAQEVIGVPHPESAAALKILQRQGFRWRGAIDIFDAGPSVEAYREEIRTVRNCHRMVIGKIGESDDALMHLIANPKLDSFRVASGKLHRLDAGEVALAPELAELLGVSEGDEILVEPEQHQL